MIPYGRQNIDQDDIEAVADVLKSDWITQGPVIEQFEKAMAGYGNAAHGVAINSATSAWPAEDPIIYFIDNCIFLNINSASAQSSSVSIS